MPAGRPRLHQNAAQKQADYRDRKAFKDIEARQLALRSQKLLEVAVERGIVLNVDAPKWAQMEELTEWLRSH